MYFIIIVSNEKYHKQTEGQRTGENGICANCGSPEPLNDRSRIMGFIYYLSRIMGFNYQFFIHHYKKIIFPIYNNKLATAIKWLRC